jgi:hypothetical protein
MVVAVIAHKTGVGGGSWEFMHPIHQVHQQSEAVVGLDRGDEVFALLGPPAARWPMCVACVCSVCEGNALDDGTLACLPAR